MPNSAPYAGAVPCEHPTGHPLAYHFSPELVPVERCEVYRNPLAARNAVALVAATGGTLETRNGHSHV